MTNSQLAILERLESIVQSITPANGYLSDLSEIPVIYWQDTDFEYSKKIISIQDYLEQISTKNQSLENTLLFEIAVIQPVEQVELRLVSSQLATDFKQAFTYRNFGENLAGIYLRTTLNSVSKKVETKGIKVLKVCANLTIKYKEEISHA